MTRRIIQIYRGTTAQNDAFTGEAGELTMDTTTNELRLHNGSTVGGKIVSAPVCMVAPFAGSTAPDGWLICDGSAISRTTYARLFAAIGTTYGSGDGSTTFNLPNKSPERIVVETGTNVNRWYRLYSDGWVEQGERHYYSNSSSVAYTAVFLIEMADTNYSIAGYSGRTDNNADAARAIGFYNPTTTDVGVCAYRPSGWGSVSTTYSLIVCGMSARGATQQNIVCIKY